MYPYVSLLNVQWPYSPILAGPYRVRNQTNYLAPSQDLRTVDHPIGVDHIVFALRTGIIHTVYTCTPYYVVPSLYEPY
jgi:hypothetical protein